MLPFSVWNDFSENLDVDKLRFPSVGNLKVPANVKSFVTIIMKIN